jgi:Domain of unknown function (DUF5615)
MLAFLMDQHIRLEITEGLRRRGLNVLTAFDDNRSEAEDEELLERATILQRVFVSQDQDLLRIATEWQATGREFAGVAFAIQQNIDIGGSIEYLELIAHIMSPDEMRSHVEYIPVRR